MILTLSKVNRVYPKSYRFLLGNSFGRFAQKTGKLGLAFRAVLCIGRVTTYAGHTPTASATLRVWPARWDCCSAARRATSPGVVRRVLMGLGHRRGSGKEGPEGTLRAFIPRLHGRGSPNPRKSRRRAAAGRSRGARRKSWRCSTRSGRGLRDPEFRATCRAWRGRSGWFSYLNSSKLTKTLDGRRESGYSRACARLCFLGIGAMLSRYRVMRPRLGFV